MSFRIFNSPAHGRWSTECRYSAQCFAVAEIKALDTLKVYDYDTVFTFGKHRGQKLIDVITSDWEYINWCQESLDHFIFAEAMMYVLKEPNGEFKFSKIALEKRQNNLALLRQQKDDLDRAKQDRYQEIQNEADQDEFDNYDPYTEESGDYNNNSDFSTDTFDEY